MDYIGEHLLPGQLGHFFIVLSLVLRWSPHSLILKSHVSKQGIDAGYWKNLARYAFITEAISVLAIFGILFYIILQSSF